MYPIHLQDGNHGMGMGYSDFMLEFKAICEKHLKEGNAKAFAFIFYDVTHGTVRTALKEAGGFKTLNEASGSDLTLFYLHGDAAEGMSNTFNQGFLQELGVTKQVQPPCIVFFRVYQNNIEDVSVHSIDSRTQEPHMVEEQLRRLVVENIAQQKKEGDISALTDIVRLLPLSKFLMGLRP